MATRWRNNSVMEKTISKNFLGSILYAIKNGTIKIDD